MSTILYEDEKFLKIKASLRRKSRDIMYLWNYPPNWEDGMLQWDIIDKFVQDLRLANTRAWNERYEDESEPDRILPKTVKSPYANDYELIKSLSSIQYNIDEVSVNNCAKILPELIYHLMYHVISNNPQWEAADVW